MNLCCKCGNVITKSFNLSYNKSKSSESSNVSSSLDSKEKSSKKTKNIKRDSLKLFEEIQKNILYDQNVFIKKLDLSIDEQQNLNNLLAQRWKTDNITPLSIFSFLPYIFTKSGYVINNDKALLLQTLKYPYKIKETLSLSRDQFSIETLNISHDLYDQLSKKIRYLVSFKFHLLYIKELIICDIKQDGIMVSNKKAQSFIYTIYIDWFQSNIIEK